MPTEKKSQLIPWKKEHSTPASNSSFRTPPRIIYRYLSMNRAKSVIADKQLYFTTCDKLNDPFDMIESLVDYKMNKDEIKKMVLMKNPFISKKDLKEHVNIYFSQPGQLYEMHKREWDNGRLKTGVCCFSESPNIPLMWSHYADSHKGVCLGFDIEPFPEGDTNKALIQPVNYLDKLVPVRVGADNGQAVGHWFFTKSKDWSYEKEVRAVFAYKTGLVSFATECLKEVYFGCRVPDEDIQKITSLLDENNYCNVKCFKMELDNDTLNVIPKEMI